jgi:NAD(P)-dependent dehydrogenase (short-subunit alcohol dehydrogenase family)
MSKVWFVTGASRGLGRSIVEAALQNGDSVVATARQPEKFEDLVQQHGQRILPLTLDVANYDQVLAAVQAGYAAFGRYDLVVNNAGYADTAAVEDMTLDVFKAQVDTNFYGVVHVSKAVLPLLRAQGSGHIYQSAKWAVGGFSTVLAQEVAPLGIQMTVLEPGGMRTDWAGSSITIPPISAPYQPTVGAFANMLRAYSGQEPTDPAQVAQAIIQLANRPDAPVRLLLGVDAAQYAAQASQALAASDAQWHELSTSVSSPS